MSTSTSGIDRLARFMAAFMRPQYLAVPADDTDEATSAVGIENLSETPATPAAGNVSQREWMCAICQEGEDKENPDEIIPCHAGTKIEGETACGEANKVHKKCLDAYKNSQRAQGLETNCPFCRDPITSPPRSSRSVSFGKRLLVISLIILGSLSLGVIGAIIGGVCASYLFLHLSFLFAMAMMFILAMAIWAATFAIVGLVAQYTPLGFMIRQFLHPVNTQPATVT